MMQKRLANTMLKIALESVRLKLRNGDLNAIQSHFLHFLNTFATTQYVHTSLYTLALVSGMSPNPGSEIWPG